MVKSGRIRVTNKRAAPKAVYDVNGKSFSIAPNDSVVLYVSERQEADLRKSKYLSVDNVEDGDVDDVPPMNTDSGGDEGQDEETLSPQELLEKADDLTYAEFARLARATLGGDFPTGRAGGQPKKAELVRVLRRLVKE